MTKHSERCPECLGQQTYFTEWSDSAESNPYLRSLVVYYPDPPDGTVEIKCSRGCSEPPGQPKWMKKHPCQFCSVGYGECAQGHVMGIMCCAACQHPTRWYYNPYTAEDYEEMGVIRDEYKTRKDA